MNVKTAAPPFPGTMDVDEFMAFLETRPPYLKDVEEVRGILRTL